MAQQDESTRVGLIVAFGAAALVVLGVVGSMVVRTLHHAPAAGAAAPGEAASAASAADKLLDELLDMPLAGQVVGKVYFDSGVAELPADAGPALDAAIQALNKAEGKRLVLSGFHDASGDPARNVELAKARALAVRAGLLARGANPQRIGLRKPEETVGGDHPEEARRVELRLVETR